MSVPALAARAPASGANALAGAAPNGAAACAGPQGDGGNVFAALLAGLGELAEAAPATDDTAASPAALPVDAAAAGAPALPAAAPDPLAGMALLMAQYTPGVAPAAIALPSAAPAASATSTSAALPATLSAALPGAPIGAAATAPAATACTAALTGTDPFNAAGPARPDPTEPTAAALLPALAADAAPVQAAADPQAALQALPDMASLAAGWATAPAPAAPQGPAAAVPVYQAELPSRPGDAAFAGDLAAQVTVLVEGGFQQAELRLNPADLGPIQIQLSVSALSNTADISFSAVHGLTRESIEQALPELRDMLEAQGLSLGQTGVSGGQQQPGDGRDSAAAQGHPARPGAAPGADGTPGDAGLQGLGLAAAPRATRGMLDLYA